MVILLPACSEVPCAATSRAQELLKSIESQIAGASVEARVRYELEYGRTLSSAKHRW